MDKQKENFEEIKSKEKKEKELKKEQFSKILKELLEKKYDLSSETIRNLLKLKLSLDKNNLENFLENTDLKEKFSENELSQLKQDLDTINNFDEKFDINSSLQDNNDNQQDDFKEIFTDNDWKIVKNLFSKNFVNNAKNGKIIPWIVVWTTNSTEKIIKLWAWVTIWFLKSFYDIYQILTKKAEYKKNI